MLQYEDSDIGMKSISINLDNSEVEILNVILREFVIKDRTGELGILHGADRFVSTNICLKKRQRNELKALYNKFGMQNFPKEIK